jgi:UDP:flavonoid glycosyltransferase YjiC (YdhE family)
MRALFTTHPAASHLDPMLPLVREMAVRGWDVAVAAPEPFGADVRRRGLDFVPAGLPWLESAAASTFPQIESMPLDEQGYWWVTDIFAGLAGERTARDLAALCTVRRPDLLVRDYWDFGAWAVATALDIPCAVVGLSFHEPAEDMRDFLGDRLTVLLNAAGMPRHGSHDPAETLYRGPYIDLLPESYQTVPLPGAVRMAHATRAARPRDVPWVSELREPRVVVTFGTVFNSTPGVFENVIAALADEPLSVIVTTGANRSPDSLGHLPANTRAARFVDYADLLPLADAVVCHAGFNTVMAALAHDLPVVAIPLSADQPSHAARCRELGVGIDLGSQPTRHAITKSVRTVLESSRVRKAAHRLGSEIRSMPPASTAADQLERYAHEAGPE